MKKLLALMVLASTISIPAVAAVGYLTGEMLSGTNKICYYNSMGSTIALTISATSLCPLTIQD